MVFGYVQKKKGYSPTDSMWISDAAKAFDAWPLPNVWLGVSVENQATADERIDLLLHTPAVVRFISAEPLLEAVNLTKMSSYRLPATLDWVIVGGESGNGSRECNVEWIRSIVKQCQQASVPVFVKQLGMKPYVGKPGNRLKQLDKKKGGWMESWPEDLRVRQIPEVRR